MEISFVLNGNGEDEAGISDERVMNLPPSDRYELMVWVLDYFEYRIVRDDRNGTRALLPEGVCVI